MSRSNHEENEWAASMAEAPSRPYRPSDWYDRACEQRELIEQEQQRSRQSMLVAVCFLAMFWVGAFAGWLTGKYL